MKNFTRLSKCTILLVFALFFVSSGVYAQSPDSFKYQAVLRDLDGKVLAEKAVEVEISILQGSSTGTSVVVETFNVTTNKYGLTNLEIGSVNPTEFAAIDWSNGPYFIKVSVDGDIIGTSQLLSVPYALHAGSVDDVDDADADPVNELQDISLVGNQLSLSMGSTIALPDADSTNELQMLSISGNELTLSNGNSVILEGNNFDGKYSSLTGTPTNVSGFTNDAGYITDADDADADPTNELQILSISGNQLTLSDGNTVTIPASDFDGNYSSLTGVPTKLSDFTNDDGFITNADDADSNPTNEIQILSIEGSKITLSNGGFVMLPDETDPDFNAWDKSTGISITESQITDLTHFTAADETDPDFNGWDKSTGISITESQITDLDHFTTADETDPDFNAWDKSTGISITESQITDLTHFTAADETDPDFNAWDKSTGISITESQITDLTHFSNLDETDPIWTADKNDYYTSVQVASLPISTFTNDAGYLTTTTAETDPDFNAWDKSTGISITESQISDLDHFTTADETDQVFVAWDKSTGISITESQISDLDHFTNADETDQVFVAWDKSTGISITESQISDLDHFTNADETDPDFNAWDKSTGISITESQISDLDHFTTADETDQVFVAWDKSTGISITESQISDLDHFTNADETDQVFVAWDKSTGISITESQISDLDHFTNADETDQVFTSSLAAGITATDTTWWGRKDILMDADKDTKIQMEKSSDEDIIRFDLAGFEQWAMKGARLEPSNSGNSVFIGFNAGLADDKTGNSNVFLGYFAGQVNTSGDYNTAVGTNAMSLNADGVQNTALGAFSLQKNTTGDNNTAIGYYAMYGNRGDFNTAIGHGALTGNTTSGSIGDYNTAIGYQALYNYTSGNDNSAMGNQALFSNTTGNYNIAIGTQSNFFNTNGHNNISIGFEAGRGVSSNEKNNNVFIGHQAGRTAGNGATGNVFIGYNAGYAESGAVSNKLIIENSNSTTPLIYGEFDNDLLKVNGTLELANGTSAASIKFFEPSGSGTEFTAFKSQAQAASVTYTLPAADGTAGQILRTNGSGVLSWVNDGVTSPVTITGGTINGTTIATSDITVGTGKTLDVSAGTLTLTNDQISGDKVEGGTINAVTINTATIASVLNIPIVDISSDVSPNASVYTGAKGDLVCFITSGGYGLWINTNGTSTGWVQM